MTQTFRRIGLGIGATALALLMAGTSYQNLSAQAPDGGGRGGRPGWGGPGGPGRGGPGGPLGPMMLGRLNLTADQIRQRSQAWTQPPAGFDDSPWTGMNTPTDAAGTTL